MQSISPEIVRRALADLSRDRAPRSSPLAGLTAVARELRRQGIGDSPAARIYAVGRLVTALAEDNLAALRATAGIAQVRGGAAAVAADFGAEHAELEAWSAVYHVYLRPDLNLDLRRLTALLGDRHRRTVQRRLRRGVQSLTRALFAAEASAVLAERREAASWALPRLPAGAAEEEPTARAAAAQLAQDPGVLVICGPPGSGKTTLATLVARELARSEGLEIAWVDEEHRSRRLAELGLDGEARGPRALASERVVAVIDDCDDPATVRALEALSRPACPVVVTTICNTLPGPWARRIARRPLRPDEALDRARAYLAACDPPIGPLADEHLALLVDATEGCRLALQLALQQLRLLSLDAVTSSLRAPSGFAVALTERLWRRRWLQAPPLVREAIMAGSDGGRYRIEVRGDAGLQTDVLAMAVELGLLTSEGSALARTYRLPPFLPQALRLEKGRSTAPARSYPAPSRSNASPAARAAAS